MTSAAAARYRPALDGIRAVAVGAVIAYHVGSGVPGGFLGVDVFFVLSGYLITGLLLEEHADTGRVRLPSFWARRARRLLPAILLLLVVCAIVTSQIAPVSTLAARRGDMLATLFYYANWHFVATGQSYFAAFTGSSPLRHTWSLAIEEQFYLLWPLLLLGALWLLRRARQALPWLILAGAAASAVLMALLYNPADPARAYYGTDARAHELLIGAALAALVRLRPGWLTGDRARRVASWVAPLAAAVVVAAFFWLHDQDSIYYRGGSVLFAGVVAAGLWAVETAPRSVTAASLSLAPATWVGRISYGLYLWHWPLILWIGTSRSFASWSPRSRQVLEVALTFVAATVSFYLVERPVRYGTVPWLGASTRRFAAVALVCVVAAAGVAVQSTQISGASIAHQVTDTSDSPCPDGSPTNGFYSYCVRTPGPSPGSPVVVTAGDSTSRALDPGMVQVASARGWEYVQAGQNGCSVLPLFLAGTTSQDELTVKALCPRHVPDLLARVTAAYHPTVWIVLDGTPSALLVLPDGRVLAGSDPRREAIVAASVRATAQALTGGGAELIYVATPPDGLPVDCALGRDLPACREPQRSTYSLKYRPIVELDRSVRRGLAGLPRVAYVSLDDILCADHGRCPAEVDGVLARYDSRHFTGRFSRKIVPILIARAEHAGTSFAPDRKTTPRPAPTGP